MGKVLSCTLSSFFTVTSMSRRSLVFLRYKSYVILTVMRKITLASDLVSSIVTGNLVHCTNKGLWKKVQKGENVKTKDRNSLTAIVRTALWRWRAAKKNGSKRSRIAYRLKEQKRLQFEQSTLLIMDFKYGSSHSIFV